MTWLSRLILNGKSKQVRRDVADVHELHRTVMSCFGQVGGAARSKLRILHRLERLRDGGLVLLVQSGAEPDWARLPDGYLVNTTEGSRAALVKEVEGLWQRLRVGQRLRFRLRGNATRRVDTKSGPDGKRRNGRRVALVADDARLRWLERKAEQHGFAVEEAKLAEQPVKAVTDVPEGNVLGRRADAKGERQVMTFGAVVYEGQLRVENLEAFRAALANGVGPAKAYGFGLLSIAPVE